MKQQEFPVSPEETIISWGKFGLTNEQIHHELGSLLPFGNKQAFEIEKLHWKQTLIDSGIYALSRKRFDDLFKSLAKMLEIPVETETPPSTYAEDPDKFLHQWLVRPHTGRYRSFYASLPDYQKLQFKAKALSELTKQIHHSGAKRTLFLLLDFHQAFDEGIKLWYDHSIHLTHLSKEEQQFIQALSKQAPEKAVPLLIHTIEFHVEFRTKEHYHIASYYLATLKSCLDQDRFLSIISVLKDRFYNLKGFREVIHHYE